MDLGLQNTLHKERDLFFEDLLSHRISRTHISTGVALMSVTPPKIAQLSCWYE
jgi:hypothetical protein